MVAAIVSFLLALYLIGRKKRWWEILLAVIAANAVIVVLTWVTVGFDAL